MKVLLEHEAAGTYPPATSGVANTSGSANPLITAAAVGAGNILQVCFVKVRNKTATETTVKIVDTAGNEIFAEAVPANGAFVYQVPFELPAGLGLSLNLSAANDHHWSVLARTRDE